MEEEDEEEEEEEEEEWKEIEKQHGVRAAVENVW